MRRFTAQVACALLIGSTAGAMPLSAPNRPEPAFAVQYRQSSPPELRQGSHGEWVRTLQRRLNQLDNDVCWWWVPCRNDYHVVVDGVFGPDTAHAVGMFQAQQLLRRDGIVGPKTWAKMYSPSPACDMARTALIRAGATSSEVDFGVPVARRETGCHVGLHVYRPSTGDNTYGAWSINYLGPLEVRVDSIGPKWANTVSWASGARMFLKFLRASGRCHWVGPNYCKGA